MTILPTLPAPWPLQPGEQPTPAAEAALALLELTYNAQASAEPVLAQIGRAPDASPEAIELAVTLQRMLTDCLAVAVELKELAGNP